MQKFKKFILSLVYAFTAVMIFSLSSCKKTDDDNGNKIMVDNIYKGNGKFDRDTLYISALNVDTPKNNSLMKHDILNVGIKHITTKCFNPYFAESKFDKYIVESIWEPLMKKGYDGDYYPNILKQLPTISEDRTSYLFSLREDLHWEDGTKLTTKDIEFTYKFLMDKSYVGNFQRELLNLKDWVNYRDGISDSIAGLEILDDYNFNVIVENPNIYTIDMLNIYPLSFTYYGQHYFQGGASQLENIDIKPFGNGVFKFLGYEENNYLILDANHFYFKGRSDINNLTYKVINVKDFNNYLTSGEIDISRDNFLNNENLLKISKTEFLSGYIFPNYQYGFIGVNHNNFALKDVNVRKAISLCLDRSKIVKKISDEKLNILSTPIDRKFYDLFYEKDDVKNDFNKNTAIGLLEMSGWKKDLSGFRVKDGQKLEFKFLVERDDLTISEIFQIVKKDLEDIGINVIFEESDMESIEVNLRGEKNYDLFLVNLDFKYDSDWIKDFSTNGRNNFYNYSNSQLDEVLHKISVEFDIEQSKDLYNDAHKIISEDIPIFVLFQNKQFDVYNSRIIGINSANIFKTFYYDQIILKK